MIGYPATKNFICIKNPKLFEPDHIFEVPEVLANGYVNCEFKHAKRWYKQVYPQELEK